MSPKVSHPTFDRIRRVSEGVEGRKEQKEYERYCRRDYDGQPLHCPLLVFKGASPGCVITGWQFYLLVNPLLCLGYKPSDIPSFHIAFDDYAPFTVFQDQLM